MFRRGTIPSALFAGRFSPPARTLRGAVLPERNAGGGLPIFRVGAGVAAGRTLNRLCDRVEAEAPAPGRLAAGGGCKPEGSRDSGR